MSKTKKLKRRIVRLEAEVERMRTVVVMAGAMARILGDSEER